MHSNFYCGKLIEFVYHTHKASCKLLRSKMKQVVKEYLWKLQKESLRFCRTSGKCFAPDCNCAVQFEANNEHQLRSHDKRTHIFNSGFECPLRALLNVSWNLQNILQPFASVYDTLDVSFAHLQPPVEASVEVESREEDQETVAVEANPAVDYQEAAFRVAWRLKEDEFLLEDAREAVVGADDTTLRENWSQNL